VQKALYAGFDCSTQGLSVVVIEPPRDVVFRHSFDFDADFPAFGTTHGVLPSSSDDVVHAPPRLWSAALERMLELLATSVDCARLSAISGSAQQHGSVYCDRRLDHFTRPTAPVWMDSSTVRECAAIEERLGGPARVAQLTGSRAFPRFTGPQIRKFAGEEPSAYAATHRIHLVSSYLSSMLIGDHGPIDHGDGSGMTLMDLRGRRWSQEALDATAPGLALKLPPLVPSSCVIGMLNEAWQRRYGMPAMKIVAWSGDNLCSMIGTGLVHEGQLAISLGTSDTIFGPMREPRASSDGTGHVFASVTGAYMGLTVFRNASLAREHVRDELGLDWNGFSEALRTTPAGNNGAMMLPWFEPEITPSVPRSLVVRVGLDDVPAAQHVRAIVEAQMFAMARHSRWMDVTPRAIHATGGASANREILQVMADVFDAEVYRYESTDSAALGAALRAYQAETLLGWNEVLAGYIEPLTASRVTPIAAHARAYRDAMPKYEALEATARRRLGGGPPAT
jgi:xylulokinase